MSKIPSDSFAFALRWLRLISVMSAGFCFGMIFFNGLDPWHALDQLIWTELYGKPEIPETAVPAYRLIFRLFCLLSLFTFFLLYQITDHPLKNRESWAFTAVWITGLGWPLGSAAIALFCGAYSYLLSSAMTGLLFLPPLLLLIPHFRKNRTDFQA